MKTFVKEAEGQKEKPTVIGIKDFRKFFKEEKNPNDGISLSLCGKGRNVGNNAGKPEVVNKHFCYIFNQLLF